MTITVDGKRLKFKWNFGSYGLNIILVLYIKKSNGGIRMLIPWPHILIMKFFFSQFFYLYKT